MASRRLSAPTRSSSSLPTLSSPETLSWYAGSQRRPRPASSHWHSRAQGPLSWGATRCRSRRTPGLATLPRAAVPSPGMQARNAHRDQLAACGAVALRQYGPGRSARGISTRGPPAGHHAVSTRSRHSAVAIDDMPSRRWSSRRPSSRRPPSRWWRLDAPRRSAAGQGAPYGAHSLICGREPPRRAAAPPKLDVPHAAAHRGAHHSLGGQSSHGGSTSASTRGPPPSRRSPSWRPPSRRLARRAQRALRASGGCGQSAQRGGRHPGCRGAAHRPAGATRRGPALASTSGRALPRRVVTGVAAVTSVVGAAEVAYAPPWRAPCTLAPLERPQSAGPITGTAGGPAEDVQVAANAPTPQRRGGRSLTSALASCRS